MAFTIGSGTFTNGSATVTGVTLTSGTLAYFASGTRMVVGVNPVIQEVEAIAAPTVTTITLRSVWTGTGGTYSFLANQTSEGLRDAVQAIRSNNASLQSFIDSIDTAATADSVAQRTSDGSINAVNVYASGNIGVGTASPAAKLSIAAGDVLLDNTRSIIFKDSNGDARSILQYFSDNSTYLDAPNGNMVFRGGSGNAERARIDTSGNVGIGTSSPGAPLDVNGQVRIRTGSALLVDSIEQYTGSGDLTIKTGAALPVIFGTNNTERMRIDSSGDVLVGTTTSNGLDKLQVNGSAKASLFRSLSGGISVPTGTWTAIYTFGTSDRTSGMVSSNFLFTTASTIANFTKVWDGGNSALGVSTSASTGGGEIRAVGNTIEVLHNIGVTVTCQWSIIKIQ